MSAARSSKSRSSSVGLIISRPWIFSSLRRLSGYPTSKKSVSSSQIVQSDRLTPIRNVEESMCNTTCLRGENSKLSVYSQHRYGDVSRGYIVHKLLNDQQSSLLYLFGGKSSLLYCLKFMGPCWIYGPLSYWTWNILFILLHINIIKMVDGK